MIFDVAIRKAYSLTQRALRAPTPPLRPSLKTLEAMQAEALSNEELAAFMRHDAHRLEKAFYNNIFESKRAYFTQKRDNILRAYTILAARNALLTEPTVVWAKRLADAFDTLESTYISQNSHQPNQIDRDASSSFLSKLKDRRSVRVWAADQPSEGELTSFAEQMIEAGTWAPCSGDRQAWKFRIITEPSEKELLVGLKEEHCYRAPCLIFVGMDSRFYGALGTDEAGLYCDAAAAITQMKLLAHFANYGACWNHMCRDLIDSRPQNAIIYESFATAVGIAEYIEPVAILAFGRASFIPPAPVRQTIQTVTI